jgi:hypothetical protein
VRHLSALLALLLVTLSGCGGDDSTTGDTAGSEGKPESGSGETVSADRGSGKDALAGSDVSATFEDGTAGWLRFNEAKIDSDKSEASSGKNSLRVEADGSAPFQGTQTTPIPVDPDRTYTAGVDVWAPEGASMQVALRESDADDEELDAVAPTFEGTGDWQTVAVEKQFGPDGENARIQVRTGDEPQEVVFSVDVVTLRESKGK